MPRKKQRNIPIEAVSSVLTATGSRFAGALSGIRSLASKSSWHRDNKLVQVVADFWEYWYPLVSARIAPASTSVARFKFCKC